MMRRGDKLVGHAAHGRNDDGNAPLRSRALHDARRAQDSLGSRKRAPAELQHSDARLARRLRHRSARERFSFGSVRRQRQNRRVVFCWTLSLLVIHGSRLLSFARALPAGKQKTHQPVSPLAVGCVSESSYKVFLVRKPPCARSARSGSPRSRGHSRLAAVFHEGQGTRFRRKRKYPSSERTKIRTEAHKIPVKRQREASHEHGQGRPFNFQRFQADTETLKARGDSWPRAVTRSARSATPLRTRSASSKLFTVGQTCRGSKYTKSPTAGFAAPAGTSMGRCSSLGARGSRSSPPRTMQFGTPQSAETLLCPASQVKIFGAGWLTTRASTTTAGW